MPCFSGYYHNDEKNATQQMEEKGLKLSSFILENFLSIDQNQTTIELRNQLMSCLFLGISINCPNQVELSFVSGNRKFENSSPPLESPVQTLKINTCLEYNEELIFKEAMKIIEEKKSVIDLSNNGKNEKELINTFNKNQYLKFIVNHAMFGVFEFLDTKTLIESCMMVCKEWFEMILFDEQFTMQVVVGRMRKLMDRLFNNNGFKSSIALEILKELYRNLSWIEIYLMSGLFHLEMCEKDFRQIISRDYHKLFCLIRLDPFAFLNLSSEHVLYKRLKIKAKYLMLHYEFDNLNQDFCRNVNRRIQFGEIYCLEEILSTPIVFPRDLMGFSLNFQEELESYLDFLNEITSELSPLIQDHSITVATYLNNMLIKAKRFISRRNPLQDYSVGKDVLIGMHLLFLDNFYTDHNLQQCPSVVFSRLLQTRNSQIEMPNKFYPKKYRSDSYQDLIKELSKLINTKEKKKKWKKSETSFQHPHNSIEFLKEHIFDLSKVANKVMQDKQLLSETIRNYQEFMKTKELSVPSKEVDFIFHFHLLHPNNYVQDSRRIAGFVKFHDFNFSDHK